jgi:hypothetical protein
MPFSDREHRIASPFVHGVMSRSASNNPRTGV